MRSGMRLGWKRCFGNWANRPVTGHGGDDRGPGRALDDAPRAGCRLPVRSVRLAEPAAGSGRQRGLLEDTLVLWGGEFGRTPMAQGGTDGRDHHPNAFTMWMAGGGVKPGITLGETDELGFNVVKDKVHVHDLHATILHLLGFDHTRLTYRFQGRDFRLTDVHGSVVKELLA
jgi:Protein of unknown function (DUF1501)